jgi:crossover junction endodeoxyribonuclease RuvC
MRVLGLDPGSRRTGWGVVERRARELRCVAAGHVAPPARLSLAERLHAIVREVDAVMERFAPDCVVIEAAFHHAYARSTLVLGHVRGALMVAAVERGLEVAEYAPRAIKLAVTGRGGAAKEQVTAMVKAQLGLTVLPQVDAADALAGAMCHLRRARFDAPNRRRTPAGERLQAILATARGSR